MVVAETRPELTSPALVDRDIQPADWPNGGALDLATHDLPHASSTLEWWYVNAHLETDSGRDVSLFASFFRTAVGRDDATGEYVYAHALTWAVVDPVRQRYTGEALVDQDAPRIGLAQLDRGFGTQDPLLRRAMREVLARGDVPRPDIVLDSACHVDRDRLALQYGENRFERLPGGAYHLELHDAAGNLDCDLTVRLKKPVVRHGAGGLVQGKSGEDMFYYFSPRCEAHGAITLDGTTECIARGTAWYDHEFGQAGQYIGSLQDDRPPAVAWDWIGAQLDNGWDLTVYCMVDAASGDSLGRFAILVDPSGQPHRYGAFTFEGHAPWTSSKTFVTYPTTWRISIPEAGLALEAQAALPAQELITTISSPSFWEGRVDVRGRFYGTPVNGKAFVERCGFDRTDSIERFFAAVGKETRRSVRRVLPLDLDTRTAATIVSGVERSAYVHDLDLDHLSSSLIAPIRTIVDRGGKAWRSYVLLACCDVVGGDSQPYIGWLAMPELMHVGSLIVDDVEDRSSVRRGGPAVHTLFGEPLAINAGTLCYFLPQISLAQSQLPPDQQVRIYELYFEAARAAHAGQALDLAGFAYAMPDIVARGDGASAQARVRAIHRLKSAAPAGSLARIGAIIGGGTDAQIDALGVFVEHVGLAFQIVDDVLNLRGFANDLKQRGEDLREGKITMPVAKALGLLDLESRTWLCNALQGGLDKQASVEQAIDLLEACGALQACQTEAEQLVDEAWSVLDPLVPDSLAKLMLRSFSWFVLERHY
jgi:geranylgeranyl pyrophosphate synthase/predicted secreted hydrolase